MFEKGTGILPRAAGKSNDERTITIRDRRKPNQYTTDNVIARGWLPILRVGDAFFFYTVYLSMANRKTESSWGSLRTMAQYLQCGVDLIIRGNKLLEICELIHIETGNQHTSNEYYILDPPLLTPELEARIHTRLGDIQAQETSKNWQSWVKQVIKALDRHQSLPTIWAERRANRGGRPVKAVRRQPELRQSELQEKGGCESQPGLMQHNSGQPRLQEKGGCDSQPGCSWDTTRVLVSHNQGACDSQPEQEQLTRVTKKKDIRRKDPSSADLLFVQARCRSLGVVATILGVLLEKYSVSRIKQQLEWLPARRPRDPAAMLVSAVQENWAQPAQYDPVQSAETWSIWMDSESKRRSMEDVAVDGSVAAVEQERLVLPGTGRDAQKVWARVLCELEMQMTRATYDTWLRGSGVISVRDGGIVVLVRNEYAAEWLRTRWDVPIRRTLDAIAGRPTEIHFEVQR